MNMKTAMGKSDRFLKSADVDPDSENEWLECPRDKAGGYILTIRDVTEEELRDSASGKMIPKCVVWFEECEKGLVLNATNNNTVMTFFGEESDDWLGKRIALTTAQTTDRQGNPVMGIRVKMKLPAGSKTNVELPPTVERVRQQQQQQQQQPGKRQHDPDRDDPFGGDEEE